jgi:hypothetical protein
LEILGEVFREHANELVSMGFAFMTSGIQRSQICEKQK